MAIGCAKRDNSTGCRNWNPTQRVLAEHRVGSVHLCSAAEGYAESSEAQEAVHPTYFGQRTLSACMRAALSQPSSTQEVFCTRDDVLSFNEDAQPAVTVTPAKLPY